MPQQPKKPDGRANNGAKLKYDEPKDHLISGRLTKTAYDWFERHGKWDWIEKQARQIMSNDI